MQVVLLYFQLKQDLDDFERRLRLCEFFYDPEITEEEEAPQARRFKEKSTWTPQRNQDTALETYIKAVRKDIWSHAKNVRRRGNNLTQEERQALKLLQRRTDIIIKPADKGSATVVMSREAYLAEAHRQLMDQNYYCQLDQDLTTYHAEQITSLVRTMVTDRHISKETGKYLTPTNPRAARFYHLSKIHKPSHPGRPIVSSCGAPTERISECRVSNLKYKSVCIDSKTVVFVRANPGKKETTDGSGSHVIFFRDRCTFPEVVSSAKWHVTKKLSSP